MKWRKYTVETTTQAEDLVSSMLTDLGADGVQIEDNVQLSEDDTKAMFVDILPELPPDDGTAKVSFFLEEDENGIHYPDGISGEDDMKQKIAKGLEELKSFVNV